MAKLPSLDFVKYVRSKGKVYAYFNTGRKKDGKPIYARLPDPSAVGFYDSYAAFVGGRTKRQQTAYTIAKLAEEFELSPDFRKKAKGTQRLYSITLRRIGEDLGEHPVNDLQRSDVRTILEGAMATKPGAHNIFLAVLGILYAWARAREKTDLNPTLGIKKLDISPHEPWPDEIVEAALVASDDRVRLATHLLYFTGQRIGDVCKMRWSDIKDGYIRVTQQKRGKRLEVRLASELLTELARTPKRGLTIITSQTGNQVTPGLIREELKAFTRQHGVETVAHGLRKNAVNALLQAGGTVAEVAAITGQTYRVVEYYAQRVNNKAMGSAVILKLENIRATGKSGGKPLDQTA